MMKHSGLKSLVGLIEIKCHFLPLWWSNGGGFCNNFPRPSSTPGGLEELEEVGVGGLPRRGGAFGAS